MINEKPRIVQSLLNNASLNDLIAGRIYHQAHPQTPIYPLVTYTEVTNLAINFADNLPVAYKIEFYINIFNDNATNVNSNQIIQQIESTMQELGYFMKFVKEFNEEDTLNIRVFLFSATIEN